MEHSLKCWPEYFKAVKSGEKPFEVRKWERPYKVGDVLLLQEFDPKTQDYTGQYVRRTITYILDMTYLPGDNIPHFAGYVVLGLENPDIADLRNELCLKCGKYKTEHEGSCEGCRWRNKE